VNTQAVMSMSYQAMKIALALSAPLLLTILAIGLIVSIFQAATQINEMTLSFIPKLLGMCAVLVLLGPWLANTMIDYIRELFQSIPQLAS
jgi:flagellar biosynthetic protein FliQ